MIARLWRGRAADAAKADAYVRHFTGTVTTELKGLAGHRGAWLLRREVDGGAEFIALTLWESRQSIEAFTGPDISKSVVEPEARAVLSAFDDFATHYDVAFTGGNEAGEANQVQPALTPHDLRASCRTDERRSSGRCTCRHIRGRRLNSSCRASFSPPVSGNWRFAPRPYRPRRTWRTRPQASPSRMPSLILLSSFALPASAEP